MTMMMTMMNNDENDVCGSVPHPSFKATLTGFRKTRLRKAQICPRLAETKRKNIFSDQTNSRFRLGSSRYWLHKFDQNIIKIAFS